MGKVQFRIYSFEDMHGISISHCLKLLIKKKGGKFSDQEINQYYEILLQYILNRVEYAKQKI